MSNIIESQVFSGELYIKASDHHRAVAASVAAERESCAKACEELLSRVSAGDEHMDGVTDCIAAIRARGNK
jgi:hypothetical protein